jgi:hypothetical protein
MRSWVFSRGNDLYVGRGGARANIVQSMNDFSDAVKLDRSADFSDGWGKAHDPMN